MTNWNRDGNRILEEEKNHPNRTKTNHYNVVLKTHIIIQKKKKNTSI